MPVPTVVLNHDFVGFKQYVAPVIVSVNWDHMLVWRHTEELAKFKINVYFSF
jgi:hypothetical protein